MGTAAWVCFECRTAVRRDTQYDGDVPCPNCGRLCVYLGYKIPVPPKRKRREWLRLRTQLSAEKAARELDAYLVRDREKNALRQEIARLVAKGPNPGRASTIRRLQRRLAWLES